MNASAMYRFMRALASLGVFRADGQKKFHLTPLGSKLLTDRKDSLKHIMLSLLGDHFMVWTEFLYTIRTGKSGFERLNGKSYHDHLNQTPTEFENWRISQTEFTRNFALNVANYYDFSTFKHIVEICGGDGTFLAFLLTNAPQAKGTLFDCREMVESAKKNLATNNVKGRITCVVGNLLTDTIPAGGDCYVLKSVIPQFEDSDALKILTNVRQQIKSDAKLLLIQSVLPESNEYHAGKWYDLLHLLLSNGSERTEREIEDILHNAGFRLNRIIKTAHPMYDIIEAKAN
ncbi:hypothetical protein B4U79_16118 [Dinothrombium tinctorium]|uniref:Acetylserotonin O-methyltransferase n=1 Tax=Dinothrombium tinctorium TaxID=1965070 RepID=A0A3S5WGU3_9ACAR|nr:hypothetical protein B4U79_16118 [Dinothrombium tinctorium]